MDQYELFAIESPCRGICENSKKGYCKGCLRSRDERFHWHGMTEVERRHVLHLCRSRWQRIIKARQDKMEKKQSASLPYGMDETDMLDLFSTPAKEKE
ncbi:DUF1289 domain-containing protein [Marinomonas mediterranea]|uniref:Fe-S protein n=1 Tax=Marinomonas mediterranea (strain ATCC 700492 / JCM 21426 / NBRC 103028 / MMB-1) TaxID=717774 RepID=F2JTN5_MARM1|nr:DUF1289 domain-containing protein [Marinomonas mediterranea]ADZ92655.1 protein of unknown function DUF1289 [Marinomonas mediterranea MMB-1]WCN10592.1 DUF1289 domain-containing protein [Marinomonas mediterranea]WCN18689.1 DUF1289 domain-containing protein [Marinomonas mediterranea MMB-1]